MAGLWFSVLVVAYLQQAFARDCSVLESITSCDECVRCGGIWCHEPDVKSRYHCSDNTDGWCPSHREKLLILPSSTTPGSLINPKLIERSVAIDETDHFQIIYEHSSGRLQPNISTTHTSTVPFTNKSFDVTVDLPDCKQRKCSTRINVRPTTTFCPRTGTSKEFIIMKTRVSDIEEEVTARYHVPCACECSKNAVKKAKECNLNGNFVCGACSCYSGWSGEFCNITAKMDSNTDSPSGVDDNTGSPYEDSTGGPGPYVPVIPGGCDRGDISGCIHPMTGSVCSDNGRCLCGGKCICDTSLDGARFFDDYCADICTAAGTCDACLINPTPGLCEECYFAMHIENTTKLPEGDQSSWVKCNETTPNCVIEYAATRDQNKEMHVIVTKSCKEYADSQVGARLNVTVPVIIGVIALVAAAAAVAGYMVWKNKTPPLPLTDPQYQNIDAEDCTGMNPLYKPPTSSFKNPTYGKW